MRGDVLPPKRQAVVDRLRRRIELYRRHHNATLPRYEQAANAVYEEQRQETLLLKQRYLESKAKKSKKSEHKSLKDSSGAAATSSADSHKNILQKSNKRPAVNIEASHDPATDTGQSDDKDHRHSKMARTSNSASDKHMLQQQKQMSLDSQHMQIPGFECIKQQSIAPKSPVSAGTSHDSSILLCNVKKECDSLGYCGQTNDCVHSQEATTSAAAAVQDESADTGEKFLDAFPNLGLPEDSSEVWVDNPEILRHLIDDITNPSDLMTDFNFNYGMEGIKDTEGLETVKTEGMGNACLNEKKGRQQHTGFSGSESFIATSQASQVLVSPYEQRSSAAIDSMAANAPCLPQQSFSPSNTRANQFSASNMGSLDFKLSEPSPAAQTLKQMAEQHQQHKQGHDKHSLGLGVPRQNFSPGDNFDVSLAASRSAIFSSADNSLNSSKVMQTSTMFPNVGFGNQALTTTIQSNFRADNAARVGNALTGVAFGKLNGAQSPYAVSSNPLDAARCQTVSQMPVQEQQRCSPKGVQYTNSSTDEKTTFVNNFKASLAKFNEVNSAPSPPLVKSPSQFTKQMSSPLSSQTSMMMGPSGHSTIQANAMQPQGMKDTKDISPLNISSNPSYADALAFSSGNARGMSRSSIGPTAHFQTQQQAQQQQQAQMQQHREKPGFSQIQFMEANQLTRPPSSSPTDVKSLRLHYSQNKGSIVPQHHLQHYTARVQNPMGLQGLPQQGPLRVARPSVPVASNQLPSHPQQYVQRMAARQPTSMSSVPFQNPGSLSFGGSRMPLTVRASSPQQMSGPIRHPLSAASVTLAQKPSYTNATMRPQLSADFPASQREWQCAMGQAMQQQQQQQPQQRVGFQTQTSQVQSRVVFSTAQPGSAPRPPPFQPPQLSAQQQQAMTSTLPPLPQLQIPPRSTAPQTSTFSPSLSSSIADFNLEFLESIENSDSDLLNFDPVNSNFGILDDVLGGK
uniref:Putative mastermind-like protein 3 n=1 Tax=Rhipicephalus pulchellus TaxID=72859 RepID=L7M9H9_RHIPC